MLHLQNDVFSTKLAFHAPSERLNSLSVLLFFIPEFFLIVITVWNASWKRQTDNGAISNFEPQSVTLLALALQPWPFGFWYWMFALCCVLAFSSFGGSLALWFFALWPFWPLPLLALWPF